MPVHNTEIACAFDHLADLLEIEGANPFRVRAYRNAARTNRGPAAQRCRHARNGRALAKLPGIAVTAATTRRQRHEAWLTSLKPWLAR
jgi:DNA polymerase (family X)